MSEINTEWANNEFKAYLFLYAAKADYIVTDTEKDIIEELVDKKQYKKIYAEFEKDNDIQSLDKITHNLKKFNYSKNDIDTLLNEVKELFLADGQFNQLEKIMLNFFNKNFKA